MSLPSHSMTVRRMSATSSAFTPLPRRMKWRCTLLSRALSSMYRAYRSIASCVSL